MATIDQIKAVANLRRNNPNMTPDQAVAEYMKTQAPTPT